MIKRGIFITIAITLAICMSAFVAACSHIQPSLGEYAITTGHGSFSNQQVISVTAPGHRTSTGSGTTSWYFPANVRNYVTGPNGDRAKPTAAFTGTDGNNDPAISDYVYTYVGWEVNPAITNSAHSYSLASHFLQFCLKYACATQQPQNNVANSVKDRSSDPGWLNMTDEIFPRAIDNATRTALRNFPPSIWTSSGEASWSKLAIEISANLSSELQALDGSKAEGQPDYFCGLGSTTTHCASFLVQVNGIQPTDPGVVQAYQQQQQANYSLNAAASRVALAKKLYGADAGWFLGMFDLANKCPHCTIFAGNAPFHP